MRTKTLALTAALTAAGALTSMAQVYSVNIVGYINLNVPQGFSMIANQLNATPDNTLETLLPAPPEGTTIYKFNPAHGNYDVYLFSADNPGWLPQNGGAAHTTLNPGEGAFVAMPSQTQVTLVGEVQLVSNLPVNNGFQILSSVIPQSDTLDNLGFPATEGDFAYQFNHAGGNYYIWNFSADNPGWAPQNATPGLIPTPAVGESFFYASTGGSRTWNRTFTVGP